MSGSQTSLRDFALTPFFQVPAESQLAESLAKVILDRLSWNRTVCSDDVYRDSLELIGSRDPRILGAGFQLLARQGRIRKVGVQRSRRQTNHCYPNMAVWELVDRP